MSTKRISTDMSTARGIQQRIEQRVIEINAEPEQDHSNGKVIEELLALHIEITEDVEKMIEDMHRQDRERALERQIHLDDAGVSAREYDSDKF